MYFISAEVLQNGARNIVQLEITRRGVIERTENAFERVDKHSNITNVLYNQYRNGVKLNR